MARSFASASTARVDLSLGAGGSLTGACSLAAIVRRASDGATHNVINIGSTVNVVRTLRLDATNVVAFKSGASSGLGTTTVVAADGWTFIAGTKAAGTATPRVHIYKYSTRTWVHENTGSSIGDITPSGASAIGVGASNAGPFNGDIAACGAWQTALTDAQVETLAFSFVPWFSYTPNGLWVLDQAATTLKVWDQSGRGANESSLTATSVATSAVPIWNRGAPPICVHAAAAAVVNNQSLSVTQTQTATLVNSVGKTAAVTQTQAPTVLRSVGHITSVTQTQTPTALRSVGKTAAVAQTQTPTVVRSTGKTVGAAQTQTPTIARSIGKILSATQTATATVAKTVGKILAFVQTQVGSLTATKTGAVPDPNPVTLTIRDRHHTATVKDGGHSISLHDTGHQVTVEDGGHTATIRDRHHTATIKEQHP